MTILIAAVGLIALVLFIVSALWFRRATALLIPLMFGVLFWGILNAVNYVGYAVDARYLNGTEAVVLDTINGSDWVYLLVRSTKESEPRLVRIPNSDQARKDADAAKQQAMNGISVIRFGAQTGVAGGTPFQTDSPAFEILRLGQSQSYAKAAAYG